MGRAPCCDKVGLKRGPWTSEEDQILVSFIQQHGHSNWRALPKQAGLLRCGKSCRLRWINYLRPDIKRGNFSKEEEDTIIQLHEMMGNRWSAIASRLPGRTDNEIKNVWHTHLKKRLNKEHPTTLPKLQGKVTNKQHCDNDANNNNNNRMTTSNSTNSANNFSEITIGTTSDQAPNSSQQSYSSDDFSSLTEVSSVEDVTKNTQKCDDIKELELDELPIIDETFWSVQEYSYDDVSMDFIFNDTIKDEQLQLQPWSSMYIENDYNNGPIVHEEGSVNYWLDVFVRAGGAPELPEF